MRQPLLTILLIALAFITGYELRQQRQQGRVQEPVAEYAPAGKGSGGQRAGTAAVHPDPRARIRQQERLVEDLSRQVRDKGAQLDDLNNKLNQEARAPEGMLNTDAAADQLAQARSALQGLTAQRQQLQGQAAQQSINTEVAQEERKLSRELTSSQLRDQIQREQALANNLSRQVQEIEASNLSLDVLPALRSQAMAQARRVRELQSQYLGLQLQAAQERALEQQARAQQAGTLGSQATALDQQIQQEEQKVQKLEQEFQATREKSAAGRAADESLNGRYQSLKRDYDALVARLGDEKRALEQMRAKAS